MLNLEAILAKSTRSSGKKTHRHTHVAMAASMEPTLASRNAALPLGTLMLAASVGSWAQTQAAPQEKTLAP